MNGRLLHVMNAIAGLLFFTGFANGQGGTLPLNGNVNATITSTAGDTWNITIPSDGLLRLKLKATSPADLYVALYDNDGTTLLGALAESFNNSIATLNSDGLAPGTYHVRITPFGSGFGAYNLADSVFTTPVEGDPEPNGSIAGASVLPLNNAKTGHVGYYYNHLRDTADWYKVTTTSDGLLRLHLSMQRGSVYATNPLDVDVTLYDNDGKTQLGAVEVFNGNGPGTGVLTADGLGAGTYYVKVQPYATSEFANYTLSDSLFTSSITRDAEPNGSIAGAAVLPVNSGKTGEVGYYYNHQRDTADWYKITTTADGLLRLYLSTQRTSSYSVNPLDVNVTLYDNDGTTLLGSTEVFNANGPATNTITTDGLAPGTYYVKVQPYSTNEYASYKLSDTLFTTVVAGDPEPNGSVLNPVVLPLNDKRTGHVGYYYNHVRDTADWYKVTTAKDGLLRVYLTTQRGSVYASNTLDVNVTLYGNDGKTQLGFVEVFNANDPATNKITTDGLAAGTYFIKVQPYNSAGFANYTLSDSLFTNPFKPDTEPNGSRATALTLPLNASDSGQVGYLSDSRRDTSDWYKVTTNSEGLLRIYLTTSRASVYSTNPLDVNVTLYDNDGTTQLGAVEVYNGNEPATNFITADGLGAGTYYIKVQPYSTSEFANYILTDSLFVPAITADAEPNGSAATATRFPFNSNTKGHVGYYYNKVRDTTDWYKITVPAAGPLHLYLGTQRGSVYSTNPLDMVMTFYSGNGTTQLGLKEIFNASKPGVDSLTFPMVAAGDYFVKVANYSTSEFGVYSITNSLNPAASSLPVNFIHFDGVLKNAQALLSWSTATETNNKGFEVQRSSDGQSFIGIGFVSGNGNASAVNSYTFTDASPINGAGYYRLQQIDLDGKFVYSSTIVLNNKMFNWVIAGNPVTASSSIQLQLTRKTQVSISVTAMDGTIIQRLDQGIMSEGSHTIPLHLAALAHGSYLVTLMNGEESSTKVVVR